MILQSTVNQVKRTKDQEQCPDAVCKTKVSFSDEKGGFICSEGSSVWRFGVVNLVLSIAKKNNNPKIQYVRIELKCNSVQVISHESCFIGMIISGYSPAVTPYTI